MSFRIVMLGCLFSVLLYMPGALGCTAHYESLESLAKKARLILEVEPVEVSDVTPDGSRRSNRPEGGGNGQAVVKVIRVVKGSCNLKTFTLIGGPYESCAPFACYIPFEKGRRIFLILDRDLPDITQQVIITGSARVFPGDEKTLRTAIENAKTAWRRILQLYQKTSPEAYAEAQKIVQSTSLEIPAEQVKNASYPVLACLSVLLMNPEQVPSAEPGEIPVRKNGWDVATRSADDGVTQYTSSRAPYPLPKSLVAANEARAKTAPAEVIAFNRSLLKQYMLDQLFLPEELVGTLLKDMATKKDYECSMNRTDFRPFSFYFTCRDNPTESDKRLFSLSLLMALADDEPDSAVHKAGFGFRSEHPALIPELFVPYLVKHPELDYLSNWGKLSILLTVPNQQLKEFIVKAFEQEHNSARLDQYFFYFLKLGDTESADKVLARYDILAFSREWPRVSDNRKKDWLAFAAYQVGNFRKRLNEAKSTDKQLIDRIAQLEQQIIKCGGTPKREEAKAPAPNAPAETK